MAARTINGLDELRTLVGEHVGYSEWLEITQDRVNQFAEATGDFQWIHVDVERAKQGPFGGPIAHGYLTLSLGPMLGDQVWTVKGVSEGRSAQVPTERARFGSCGRDFSDASKSPDETRSLRTVWSGLRRWTPRTLAAGRNAALQGQ